MSWRNLFHPEIEEQEESMPEADHKHEWEVYAKTYAAPVKNSQLTVQDPQVLEKMLFGVTTMVLKCVICNGVFKEQMIGSDEPQLVAMVSKVNQYGPQYFQEDGVTYVLQRYVPPTKDPMTLPMR
jgi:hypothetical protein